MVYVPAGEFLMGCADEEIDAILEDCGDCERSTFADEQPQHTVYLDAFWIDRTEVTNAQYLKCAGALPDGASRYGALDMAGNVEEWVADWSDPEYYALSPLRNPAGPESGSCRQRCRVTAWRRGAMQTQECPRRPSTLSYMFLMVNILTFLKNMIYFC